MPRQVEIGIFNIARTRADVGEVQRWLEHLEVNDFDFPSATQVSDPALLIALAAKRCYMSFEVGLNPNITKVRKDYADYFDNILKSGHGSVLEHSSYSFAVEGVSRVFTAEMNRHRAGWSISEGSMRFIRADKGIPYWLPLSIREDPSDDQDLADRKAFTRGLFEGTFSHLESVYQILLKTWDLDAGDKNFDYKKKVTSCLRRILPLGIATGGVWTGNVRALRHVISMRTSAAAEEEIAHVFCRIADMIIKMEPMLFGDYSLSDDGFYKTPHWKV
jgi:thymidylate synthase (FAD)